MIWLLPRKVAGVRTGCVGLKELGSHGGLCDLETGGAVPPVPIPP